MDPWVKPALDYFRLWMDYQIRASRQPGCIVAVAYRGKVIEEFALGQDDRADVANLIGYSYRKLGDYKLAQAYYERALKADPAHVRTWQYYGLWQVEQGNRDQAQYHLTRIGALAGTGSAEYTSLASALAGTATAY